MLALMVRSFVWSLGRRSEEHADDGKDEHRQTEESGGKAHPRLLKFSRGAGEEEDGGKKDGVSQIAARAISGFACADQPLDRLGPRGRCFRHAADFVKFWDKGVRVGGLVFVWLL